MKFGCSFGIFLNSANLVCRSTDISEFLEGSFDFEISRVEYTCLSDNVVSTSHRHCFSIALVKLAQPVDLGPLSTIEPRPFG